MSEYDELDKWLSGLEYLPKFMRDFHDQKDIFKAIHFLYEGDEGDLPPPTNPVSGHVYVVDWFLWYMASRGYTLQKTRKKIEFRPMIGYRELIKDVDFLGGNNEMP